MAEKSTLLNDTLYFISQKGWLKEKADFFVELAKHLADKLDVKYAFIDRLVEGRPDSVETLALYAHGEIIQNIEYSLAGTPCENVIGKDICCYTSGVQALFPEDDLLVDMKADSYGGIPLWDSKGAPVGLIGVIDDKPFKDPDIVQSLLQIVSMRASAEIESQIAMAEIVRRENQLEQLNATLEQRVEERTRELELAKDMADKANQIKSDFLSSMSHELRTPLNAIIGFSELMNGNVKQQLAEKHQQYVGHIHAAGKHLLDLINEVLDIAKVESGKSELLIQAVDLNRVVNDCIELSTPSAGAQNISIVWERGQEKLYALTDETRFKQVLLNLISNAIKYNVPHGVVTIAVEKTDAKKIWVSVSDTGIGIPEEFHGRVFKAFDRLDTGRMPNITGTGVGLTVSKELVETLAGEIGFSSVADEGSVFWFTQPDLTGFEWNDAFLVQVDAIDDDHKVLMGLLNRASNTKLNDEEVDQVLVELIDYTKFHFTREEAIMAACDYPKREGHAGEHRRIEGKLRDLLSKWQSDHSKETKEVLTDFLRSWLVEHILTTDTKITPFIDGKEGLVAEAVSGKS
ncbi:bacteriohemerythrin [Terasakiella sp. A23]|uniref:bacteriohemerythrin n=1 Tax=Terasakiella sp. FCG-A23 TaxID=3080561 RepID=UPI0029543D6F|nr:bacteriohemerythrin [Terasakiella sp. A23]MDV7338912.1 bacteriohemerythrin [Terasakiella sp. A23]